MNTKVPSAITAMGNTATNTIARMYLLSCVPPPPADGLLTQDTVMLPETTRLAPDPQEQP